LNQIDEIAVDHNPIPISNERINTFKMDSLWCEFSDIRNTKSEELYKLHTDLMDAFQKFWWRTAETYMFEKPQEVESITCSWVNGYFKNSSYENFRPHITLGAWKPTIEINTKQFITPRLAVCHFWNYCTARTIIKERDLSKT
jgi:hypothetical protein